MAHPPQRLMALMAMPQAVLQEMPMVDISRSHPLEPGPTMELMPKEMVTLLRPLMAPSVMPLIFPAEMPMVDIFRQTQPAQEQNMVSTQEVMATPVMPSMALIAMPKTVPPVLFTVDISLPLLWALGLIMEFGLMGMATLSPMVPTALLIIILMMMLMADISTLLLSELGNTMG